MLIKADSPYTELKKSLKAKWAHIDYCINQAEAKRKELLSKINDIENLEDTSVTVFGSLARNEYTPYSDIDWTLLIDGKVNPNHIKLKNGISNIIKNISKKEIGQEATFGGMTISHDLVHKIGGNEDTNKNTTQRILLLLESCPVGDRATYDEVKKQILSTYITEDAGLFNSENKIPRFLLNDIARYWRTMCVDFAYKRRSRDGKGWAIRTIKLRLSRKLIYVSGLLSCYSCNDSSLIARIRRAKLPEKKQSILVNHLLDITSLTPLEILAKMVLQHKDLHEPARTVFDSYNDFIKLLRTKKNRDHLEKLSATQSNNDELYNYARQISHKFQNGLNSIFLDSTISPEYTDLTKKYGVF